MKPNIKENPRNRQSVKKGRKRLFDEVSLLTAFLYGKTNLDDY
jgi:hypothetical protein